MLEIPLYDYQEKTVEWALSHPYSILALDMGMGKTPVYIALKDRLPHLNHMVVCPAFLGINWKKEIKKFLKDQTICHFKASKDVYYPADADFVIASYDIAIKHEKLFEWASSVAFDEGTALKNMQAIRTQRIHKFVFENSLKRCHFLTGTPIEKRVREFYSMMALCNYNPEIKKSKFLETFTNEIEFADYFSHRIEYDKWVGYRCITIQKWEGIQRKDELKEWLKGIYFRLKSDMPEISYRSIFIDEVDDKELFAAFQVFKETGGGVNPTAKMNAALHKVPFTIKYVDGLIENDMADGPIIIFTDHQESCNTLAKHFDVNPIHGGIPDSQRQKTIAAFQEGQIPVIVGTYGTMARGGNLQVSNLIVENDYPWLPGLLKQADFRISRKGQLRRCQVHRMLGSDQDEYILNDILEAQKVLDAVY